MKKLNEFGKFLRKIRIDLDLSLNQMANELKISNTFLSSIETNSKPIPRKLFKKIYNYLKLIYPKFNIEKQKEFYKCYILSKKEIKINLNNYLEEDQIKLCNFLTTLFSGFNNEKN